MSRYAIIVGMLEDPLNLACAMRELIRRERQKGGIKLVPPPISILGRVFYLTFRDFLKLKYLSESLNPDSFDFLAEIFSTGDGVWYITISDGSEIGPFDSLKSCHVEVRNLLEPDGFIFLDKNPWEDKDISSYPI